jgi:N-acetylmuramoyl-L-alanine amidase
MGPMIRRPLALAALALFLGSASLCLGDGEDAVRPIPDTSGAAVEPMPDASASPGLGAAASGTAAAGSALPDAGASAAPGIPAVVRVWRLSLPGKATLPLPALGSGPPAFAVGPAAAYAGLGVRWDSSGKMLDLSSPTGALGRLVLGNAFFVVQGRTLALPAPMVLARGAPALDADGLRELLNAMGGPQPLWTAEALVPAPAAPAPVVSHPFPEATEQPTMVPFAWSTNTAHVAARPLTGGEIRTIVVDAGHGGKDPGARGPDGLREKDVCLDIALRLRRVLHARDPGLRVVLTRDTDVFVTLEGRTAIANRAKGDLFVSIHNNASPDPDTHGTQVFFFDSQSSDRAASDLSMRENGEANQLDIVMTDLAKNIVRDQSIGFASLVQRALGNAINLKRRDVSYAPFYVLARTEMPAILVEVAFITNPREEDLLWDSGFRQKVAASIAKGVEDYAALVEEKP